MSPVAPVREEYDAAIDAALEAVQQQLRIATDPAALLLTLKAEERFLLAARDLTNAIDDLPLGKHPKGWATS
jgi:hypothetical protein